MEPVDAAFKKLEIIIDDIEGYKSTIITEHDTRLKVIDKIFIDVLGWPLESLRTEPQAGVGFIDYQFLLGGKSKLIVEAKKGSINFDLSDKQAGKGYKLSGPVFSNKYLKAGIAQAIRYAGQKNTELACVTNGNEFVVFRASRLGDGLDSLDGMAYVFSGLEKIREEFSLFFELLAPDYVEKANYRSYFQEIEGRPIRSSSFERALRSQSSRNLIPVDQLTADIDRIMTAFFRRLAGDDDPDLLAKCFVTTRDSQRSEEKLVRISEHIIGKIRSLQTEEGEALNVLVETVKLQQRNEFVVIIGTKGAGKSTFIDRFFKYILRDDLAQLCVVARVNLTQSNGDEKNIASWLDKALLSLLENAIFGQEPPGYDEIQGMFFDEYKRRSKGTLKYLYDSNKDEFKIDFGRHIEDLRERNPHFYIARILSHIVKSRKKIPCIVFDNADHFTVEFQQRVFQYARSLYEQEICLMIVPITDRTSWQLSSDSAMKSFEFEALYLPTPPPKAVLGRRIEYIEERIQLEKHDKGKYFVGRGIRLSLDSIEEFARTMHEIFLNSTVVSEWVGNFANEDIRRCLEIVRQVVASPHIGATSLLKGYAADDAASVPPWKIIKALIKLKWDIYPEGDHEFIFNLYSMVPQQECSPLVGVRLLYFLRDVKKCNPRNPFIGVDQILEYAHAMHIDPKITMEWLSKLMEKGLIHSYDPTVIDVKRVEKIQLTPSGYQHLVWSSSNPEYILSMADVTPIRNRDFYDKLSLFNRQPRKESWQNLLLAFVDYLSAEDSMFVVIPTHEAFKGQKNLGLYIKRVAQGINVAADAP